MGGSFKWPSVQDVLQYRGKVRQMVLDLISSVPLKLPISQDDPVVSAYIESQLATPSFFTLIQWPKWSLVWTAYLQVLLCIVGGALKILTSPSWDVNCAEGWHLLRPLIHSCSVGHFKCMVYIRIVEIYEATSLKSGHHDKGAVKRKSYSALISWCPWNSYSIMHSFSILLCKLPSAQNSSSCCTKLAVVNFFY